MIRLKNAWNWLALEPHQRLGLRALQICVGLMLLFRSSTETRFASFLWGPHGIGQGSSVTFLHPSLAPWVDLVFTHSAGPVALAILMGLAATALVLGWQTRWATMVALGCFMLFESRLPEIGDGGDNVTRLLLTYMMFALPAHAKPKRGSLGVWFHNVAILAIGLQVGVVYLTSGFLKATGAKWSNGTAMYLISQVEWFSHPALRGIFLNPFVATFTTYGTMFFQIWFPMAIFTRARAVWLAIGIMMHVGIGVFMGLICFSTVMIGLELFLVKDAEYALLGEWWARLGSLLRARRWPLSEKDTGSPTETLNV